MALQMSWGSRTIWDHAQYLAPRGCTAQAPTLTVTERDMHRDGTPDVLQ